jgi:hypothetical protein
LEKEKVEFQYIITLNQYINKNESDEKDSNKISHEILLDKAVKKLSPKSKLLKKEF